MVVTTKNLAVFLRRKLLYFLQKVGKIYTLKHFTGYKEDTAYTIDDDYGLVNRMNYGSNDIYEYDTYYVWGFIISDNQPQREQRWMRTIIGDVEYAREIVYLYPYETGGTELIRGQHINSDDQIFDDYNNEFVLDTCYAYRIENEIVYYKCDIKPKLDKK